MKPKPAAKKRTNQGTIDYKFNYKVVLYLVYVKHNGYNPRRDALQVTPVNLNQASLSCVKHQPSDQKKKKEA